jgi:hypothetical protein
MVSQALLASVDSLSTDELDELIEYVATKRTGPVVLTGEQVAILEARRNDTDPVSWLTHEEFDARLDAMIA